MFKTSLHQIKIYKQTNKHKQANKQIGKCCNIHQIYIFLDTQNVLKQQESTHTNTHTLAL